jgi:peptide/nickel transport system permease protein
MRSHYSFLFGLIVLVSATLIGLLASWLAPYHPFDQELTQRLLPPIWNSNGTWEHILGTDGLGRDYLSRLIYGVRVSLIVGLMATIISGVIGSTLGLIGGYFGGHIDSLVMYAVNTKLSLPGILLAIALVALIGGSTLTVAIVLGFLLWDRYAVVVRSATQQARSNDYVAAAEAVGASRLRITVIEVLPNVMNQIIVVATLEMALAILAEAALSFLGLGVAPPTPSWGLMISEGRNFMFFKPYLILIPGTALFILVMAINLLGDGIRDITAPEGLN